MVTGIQLCILTAQCCGLPLQQKIFFIQRIQFGTLFTGKNRMLALFVAEMTVSTSLCQIMFN
jgi:hypothetical protein